MTFVLPHLSYSYDALEPFIDEETMRIHHTKHHQSYIDNANLVLSEVPEFVNLSVLDLVKKIDLFPDSKRDFLRNNIGGHLNHSLFWKFLKYGTILEGSLKNSIEYSFSSIYNFKKKFENISMNRFGSGWVWLVKKDNSDSLDIVSTANQDNPLMSEKIVGLSNIGYPIFGLDVWEHAYYLKYKNRRLDYVQSFWNILNWDEASMRFNSFN